MNETLDEQSRTDLVKYRIQRADETLKEARLLAKEGYYHPKDKGTFRRKIVVTN